MSLITVENIKKKFSVKPILDGVSFTVQKNERVALVGSNGSGKTTLLKIIMGLESADHGRVIIPKAAKIGYISQSFTDFYNNEADIRTAAFVSEIDQMEKKMRELENAIANNSDNEEELKILMSRYSNLIARFEAMDGYAFEKILSSALTGLGLNRDSMKIPLSKLSGGEKLRVLLARVIISKPDILVLDEPTNHLDIKALEWLEKYLAGFGGGVLFVSHDRVFLDKMATRVIELEFGTIRGMKSSYSEYLNQKKILKEYSVKKQRDIERQIRNEKKIVQTLRHQRKISAFNSRLKKINKLENKLQETKKDRSSLHLGSIPKSVINMSYKIHVSDEVASVEKLSKRFGDRVLFENADFLIRGGDKVGIIGDNGTGKTTLLNILSGRDSDYTGKASIGSWVQYGFITQDIIFTEDSYTVLEKILMESRISRTGEMSVKKALEYAAHYKFFGDETGKTLAVLSGGEKSRLALAIVMLDKPNCLVMDEPTNHLDIYTKEVMEEAFKEFRGTIIAISHDRYFLNNCISRIFSIDNREISVSEGNYDYYSKRKEKTKVSDMENSELKRRKKYEEHMEKQKRERIKKMLDERKIRKAGIEREIEDIEEFKSEFENNINEQTTYEEYNAYQHKITRLEKLYKMWDEASDGNREG